MGFDDDICSTGLVLGLGFSSNVERSCSLKTEELKKPSLKFEPRLTLSLSSGETYDGQVSKKTDGNYKASCNNWVVDLYRQDSAASSFSNFISVKREREVGSEEVEVERTFSRISDEDDDDGVNGRKKLRLNKAQSALLEENFKQHSTLNPKAKHDLAKELKLRPRQVEVWFQNRRARTKLKQTEVDCEFLKKYCETLTDENRKLQKEVQELKSLKLAQPLYMQLPAATLTMCPSCERIGDNNSKSSFTMAPKTHHFYKVFTNPSAAC